MERVTIFFRFSFFNLHREGENCTQVGVFGTVSDSRTDIADWVPF